MAASPSRLREIAGEFRAFSHRFPGILNGVKTGADLVDAALIRQKRDATWQIMQEGGALIHEAVFQCGAFGGDDWRPFRDDIRDSKAENPKMWQQDAFSIAANEFASAEYAGEDGIRCACGPIADAIEAEVKRLATPPTITSKLTEGIGLYSLENLLSDLFDVEFGSSKARTLAIESRTLGPSVAGSRAAYNMICSAQYGGQGEQKRTAMLSKPGVDRLRTICIAQGDQFTHSSVQQICASAALACGKTLDEFLALDVKAGADVLQAMSAKTEQSEGKGGNGSTSEQPETDHNVKRNEILAGLKPADRKAYLAFQYAETIAERQLQDREAYVWLHENGIDASKGDVGELTEYNLPAFDTWAKQLRNARNPLREQKYTRRCGRSAGRSIVAGNELEYQQGGD